MTLQQARIAEDGSRVADVGADHGNARLVPETRVESIGDLGIVVDKRRRRRRPDGPGELVSHAVRGEPAPEVDDLIDFLHRPPGGTRDEQPVVPHHGADARLDLLDLGGFHLVSRGVVGAAQPVIREAGTARLVRVRVR